MIEQGFDFLLKGGPVMWPLFLCAIIAVAVIIERHLVLSGLLRRSSPLIEETCESVRSGRYESARTMLELGNGPVSKVLLSAVRNIEFDRQQIESFVAETALEETPKLTRGMSSLDTIITIAPLLGLLGTVTGMIKAFNIISLSSGQSTPQGITGGVAEALIATATGLAIAIVTLVGYNGLSEKVKLITSAMEIGATKVINAATLRIGLPIEKHETSNV